MERHACVRSHMSSGGRDRDSVRNIYFYIKRLGMFPFKVQLFRRSKSETEPVNTKSVVQHVIR
jgi:hypothetical protein